MNMLELVQMDLKYQKSLLKRYRGELKRLPEGNLLMIKTHDSIEYYKVEKGSGKRKYINKREFELVNLLKRRKFLEKTINVIVKNMEAEKKLIKKYMPYDYNSVMNMIPKTYRFDMSSKHQEQNFKKYADGRFHETTKGLKVRSKVEAVICELLYAANLEFAYEEELVLFSKDGKKLIFHPDFSFTNLITGEKFYWEHLGMLGDEKYKEMNLEKLFIYAENGILPGLNLFITADSLDGKMDVRAIMRTIGIIKGLI